MTTPLPAEPTIRRTVSLPEGLRTLVATAVLLERLERQPRGPGAASAGQYRQVVQRQSQLLAQAPVGEALNQVLAAFPATAQLYENLHYGSAGLCRQPLDDALRAEMAASAALRAAASLRH